METKLAVPIAAPDLAQAAEQIKAAVAAWAEMLELRTDYLDNLSVGLVKSLSRSEMQPVESCRSS